MRPSIWIRSSLRIANSPPGKLVSSKLYAHWCKSAQFHVVSAMNLIRKFINFFKYNLIIPTSMKKILLLMTGLTLVLCVNAQEFEGIEKGVYNPVLKNHLADEN